MLKGFVNDWNVKLFSFRLNFSTITIGSVYTHFFDQNLFSLDFLSVFLWYITLDPNGVKYWHSSLIDDSPKKR